MRWRGDKEKASSLIVKEKIRVFINNYKRKSSQHSQVQGESQSQTVSSERQVEENGQKCSSCSMEGDLLQHLQASSQCLEAYSKHYLGEDGEDIRRSFFHLSIVLNICANSNCPDRMTFKYLGAHLNRYEECLEFYQGEGTHLAYWNLTASSQIISKKVAYLKRVMKRNKEKALRGGNPVVGEGRMDI